MPVRILYALLVMLFLALAGWRGVSVSKIVSDVGYSTGKKFSRKDCGLFNSCALGKSIIHIKINKKSHETAKTK